MVWIEGSNSEGSTGSSDPHLKTTKFSYNGFERRENVTSIDGGDNMIKFKTQTSKNVDDEVIIIYGLPAVVQHHKERAKALALCMGQAYILLFYNRMLPVIRSKGCCTKLNKNKKYVLT